MRIQPTGKWALRVASLEAHVPNVADLTAERHHRRLRPGRAPANQELVCGSTTRTITFPRFGITGTIRPYNPTARAGT